MGKVDQRIQANGSGSGAGAGSVRAGEAGQGRKDGDGPGDGAHAARPRMDAAEHLAVELARLRAKFGVDPVDRRASLDDAWMSPTAPTEEDEAEFVDAVADCLGVGLSLDAALTCWDAGGLFYEAAGQDEGDDGGESPFPVAHHPRATGRRVLVV